MSSFSKHTHGGQLHQASQYYNIPIDDWLDLSTGISPITYPLPEVPDKCWHRLPEADDGLQPVAAGYYGSDSLLAVSGSQAAIQTLPLLFPVACKVGIITPAYHSHQQAWERAGHKVILISAEDVDNSIRPDNSLDILLLVNPTNPDAQTYTCAELSRWHQQLVSNNGCLIVDEAFMDSTPEHSLIEASPKSGLIVLRSVGKFFGLAGVRLGFVWAQIDILHRLAMLQTDWSVSHPARWAGKIALADSSWQQQQRTQLNKASLRLKKILQDFVTTQHHEAEKRARNGREVCFNHIGKHYTVKHATLFAYFEHPKAAVFHQALATQGILTRLFEYTNSTVSTQNNALRFGLPATEKQWQRLEQTLQQISADTQYD